MAVTISSYNISDEKISNNEYLGAPKVIIKYKTTLPEAKTYDFITSIIVHSERGKPDIPTIINSIEEYDYIFGAVDVDSRRYVLSFLQYSPSLLVTRSVQDTPTGALPSTPGTYNASTPSQTTPYDRLRVDTLDEFLILNEDDFRADNDIRAIAQTPGTIGNGIKLAIFNIQHWNNNVVIYNDYKAKDFTNEFDSLSYCVVIFRDDIPIEVFIVPFDNIESLNEHSNEIFLSVKYTEELLDLHDGNIFFLDGNFGYYDGNTFCTVQQSFCFFGNDILTLEGGESLPPLFNDLLQTTDVLNNIDSYEIDLHIGWNVSINRPDVVNIVSTPGTIRGAIDYIQVYNTLYTDETPKMFIYGIKVMDRKDMGLEADYAGLRSATVLKNGLGVSSSKFTIPFDLLHLKTKPSSSEMDELYYNKINPVQNYKGIYFCNGEILS